MSLERPTFPMIRLRESYEVEQVDLAVEMVLENLALPRPRIDRGDIEGLRFTPVRRGGYDMTAVDDWLDDAVAELDRRTGAQPRPAVPATAAAPAASASPSVIVDLDSPRPERDSQRVRLLVQLAVLVVVVALLYVSFA
jgi:DivIVA domain-containing protein